MYRADIFRRRANQLAQALRPQWLFVVEGRVRVQAKSGDCYDLEAGDAVVIAPGERRWQGAVPGSEGTHIAVNVDAATTWLDQVSDEEYVG